MKLRNRVKLSLRRVVFYTSVSFLAISACIYCLFQFNSFDSKATAIGDYRSVTSGNLNNVSIWETYNGSTWVAASSFPLVSSGKITVASGHTVSVTAHIALDEIEIEAGAVLNILSGNNLTISRATGTDLLVNGTLNIAGKLSCNAFTIMAVNGLVTVPVGGEHSLNGSSSLVINNGGRYRRDVHNVTTGAGIWTVNSGGVYQHNVNGQNIPKAIWNTGSICEVTGVTDSKPGDLDQSFYTFIWNCPAQTQTEDLGGKLTAIDGDLKFISTGTAGIRLGQDDNYILTIGRNYYHEGGTVYATSKSLLCIMTVRGDFIQTGGTFAGTDALKDDGEGNPTINVEGNFNISGGTFDFNQHIKTSATKGITTLNLYGNYLQTGGTLTESATFNGRGEFVFTKSGLQSFVKSHGSIVNTINFTVNSFSVLDLGSNIITGNGTFTGMANSQLLIGSPQGITLTASAGNVQVTGIRNYSTGASYDYVGNASQVTGNGLPSVVKGLSINNSNNVTLSAQTSVSSQLSFILGNIITLNDTLILGTSTAATGTLIRTSGHVVGHFKRWISATATSNILFPIGISTYYEPINYSFTTAPSSGGSITTNYSAIDPGLNGINLIDNGVSITNIGLGLWTATPGNGLSGGVFSVEITATGISTVLDQTTLHLLRRANSSSAWTGAGNHVSGTGTVAAPIARRSGLTVHGQFGIGSGSSNPLPIELVYFNAKLKDRIVELSWATASEVNNDYFSIERSENGKDFEPILHKQGAGNSTIRLFYTENDEEPLNGVSYYRLKQTDFDGRSSYSEIKSVNVKSGEDDENRIQIISVAPNPFSDKFQLNFNCKQSVEIEIMILNTSGQIINQEKIQSEEGHNSYEYYDNGKMNKGIYFIYLISGNEKLSQKIIKS